MKNLLNLGKALNKAEQKEVFGGGFGDTGLPDTGAPEGPCISYGYGSAACSCEMTQGGTWNYECNRCDIGAYFDLGNCQSAPLSGGFPKGGL